MKNKTKMIIVAMCSIFVTSLFAFNANAQEQKASVIPSSIPRVNADVTKVADTNIYDVKLVEKTSAKLTVEFAMRNDFETTQSNIKYAVQLRNKLGDKAGIIVDQKIYDDEIVLQSGESKKIKINYVPPGFFKGEYRVDIIAKTTFGLDLSWGTAGYVSLDGTGEKITTSSCYLTIENDIQGKKYFLSQGVDVKPEENLLLHCNIKNNLSEDITIKPQFFSYLRSTFGKQLSQKTLDEFVLNKASAIEKVFSIPKESDPQAYDAVLILKDKNNFIIASEIVAHYVIQGESATIQGVQFDKNIYESGETAKISLAYSGNASSFPGSRAGEIEQGKLNVLINIKNGEGVSCASLFKQELDIAKSSSTFDIPITAKCQRPSADVTITDANGKVLAKGEAVTSQSSVKIKKEGTQEQNKNTSSSGNLIMKLAVILVVLLIVISLLIFFVKKKQSGGINFLIFLGALVLFTPFASTEAATIRVTGIPGKSFYVDYVLGIYTEGNPTSPKPSYKPNEEYTVWGYSTEYKVCSNVVQYAELRVDAYYGSGEWKDDVLESASVEEKYVLSDPSWICRTFGWGCGSGPVTFQADPTPGIHPIHFYGQLVYPDHSVAARADYTMYYNTYTDGACGYDTGAQYSIPTDWPPTETKNLCLEGTPSAVSGGSTGPWSWTCTGATGLPGVIGGGVASCSAYKIYVNGACGYATSYYNGKYYNSIPPSILCSAGTPSAVSLSGSSWVWNCIGESGGGTTATCTASRCTPTYVDNCVTTDPVCTFLTARQELTGTAVCNSTNEISCNDVAGSSTSCNNPAACIAPKITCDPIEYGSAGWKEVAP